MSVVGLVTTAYNVGMLFMDLLLFSGISRNEYLSYKTTRATKFPL